MKKFAVILFIVLTAILKVFAVDNSGVPKWSEICPAEFYEAQYRPVDNRSLQNLAVMDTKKLYCHSDNKVVNVTSKILILPALDCWTATKISKSSHRGENLLFNQNLDYWNQRKQAFDLNIQTCNMADINTRTMCYMQVREIERQKNKELVDNAYNNALLNQQRLQTNQLMNINSNLYNINSTLLYK